MRNLWRGRRFPLFLIVLLLTAAGIFASILVFTPFVRPWLKTLTAESRRILGLERRAVSLEEKRIREEVILKKMEEATLQFDWRAITPEYPRRRDLRDVPEKEKMKVLKETPEFKEMDREVKEYARKKEDSFNIDPPQPSPREKADFTFLHDKATEKVIQKLLGSKEKTSPEQAVDENVRLRIGGPVAFRRILERPSLPLVKTRMETEIELTFWVLPDGRVDRAVPSVRGDAELERVAIQYLKQWRFAPLPQDQPQAEQWGVIPIKFRIQ